MSFRCRDPGKASSVGSITARTTGRSHGDRGPRSQRRGARALPHPCGRQGGAARTLRRQGHPHRRRAVAREEPPSVGQLPARGDHDAGQGPGGARGGLRPRLLRRPGTGGREAGEPDAAGERPPPRPPRPSHATQRAGRCGTGRRGRRHGADAERDRRGEQRPGTRARRRPRLPGEPDGHRPGRAPARTDRPREGAPGQPDARRPGALRDGAGRPRLLPLPLRRHRPADGRLPPARLRLRPDPPRFPGRSRDGAAAVAIAGAAGERLPATV